MSTASDTGHQGIFMENGSGGFMSDLKFTGGKFGMWVGNQQFLSVNMEFDRCDTAIFMNWVSICEKMNSIDDNGLLFGCYTFRTGNGHSKT